MIDDRRFEILANFDPGVVHPVDELLSNVRLLPSPTFTWAVEGVEFLHAT